MEMVSKRGIKMKDVMNNFSDFVGEGSLFDFDGTDIQKIRVEMYNVAAHIHYAYKNHRVDSCDDFEIIASDASSVSSSRHHFHFDDTEDEDASQYPNDCDSLMSLCEVIQDERSEEFNDGSDVSEWLFDDNSTMECDHNEHDLDSDVDGKTALFLCFCSI